MRGLLISCVCFTNPGYTSTEEVINEESPYYSKKGSAMYRLRGSAFQVEEVTCAKSSTDSRGVKEVRGARV